MDKDKPVGTSLASHIALSKQQCPQKEEEKEYMDRVPYVSAIESVMYAMICCRPDIAYVVSQVSRYMANLGKEHWKALKWVLRYLQGTRSLGLIFGYQGGLGRTSDDSGNVSGPLEGFVDADYAGDWDTRRSTIGYIFSMYGGPISWRSILQPITTLSIIEAEYIGIIETAKEDLWLQRLIMEMGVEQKTVVLHSDS
ncbi:secreted RxLR effector protein 161-like [Elaeis guineensis]|uniref:secreted RxLR effector protein 161-like n=1 Tax=Elaeis guineensis var. tenera TaxID=51953 RepID=UPI003C6D1675